MNMNKIERKYWPHPEFRFWLYSSEGEGVVFFRTAEDRETYAKEEIKHYLDGDGWSDEVTGVCGGVVTHAAVQVDRQDRPDDIDEEGIAPDGTYWEPGVTYRCDYALKPVAAEPFVQDQQAGG